MKLKTLSLAFTFFSCSLMLLNVSYSKLSDTEVSKGVFTAAINYENEIQQPKREEYKSPELLFYSNNSNNQVGFVLDNIEGFDTIDYQISYTHISNHIPLQEVVEGSIPNPDHNSTILEEWIPLGTKSAGGTTVYYLGINQVDLTIKLITGSNIQETLTDSLNFE